MNELHTYSGWRLRAKALLDAEKPPGEADWTSGPQSGFSFESNSHRSVSDRGVLHTDDTRSGADQESPRSAPKSGPRVPKAFVGLAKQVCLFRDDLALSLLYRLLWRILHGEHSILGNPADADVLEASRINRSVQKDIHKMHAFVRFRKSADEHGEVFVAFHRPDHFIVRSAVPFFVRRFGSMRWIIETPDESVYWDGVVAKFAEGVPKPSVESDPVEDDWKTYYGAIANPARLRIRAMKSEMPVRHWRTLPEAEIISSILATAPARVEEMRKHGVVAAAPKGESIEQLKTDSSRCTACPLFASATQTVFGEGSEHAKLVLVGEQPGNDEDLEGRPFVGPAGQVLNEALQAAGVVRSSVYVTNAVKHFKFEQRGKIRLHKKPDGKEIVACQPWLVAELERIRPKAVLCLGATAGQSVLGRAIVIGKERGRVIASSHCESVVLTYHPSAILRATDESDRSKMFAMLVEDLRLAHALSSPTDTSAQERA